MFSGFVDWTATTCAYDEQRKTGNYSENGRSVPSESRRGADVRLKEWQRRFSRHERRKFTDGQLIQSW